MSGRENALEAQRASGRQAEANLVFAAGGGRSVLTRQHVPYPFHVTRPFRLDPARPDLATLYLQSASGGLYRADDLALRIAVKAGAAAHVTTQAATMVHDTGAWPAQQRTDLQIEDGGFLAYTPDPLVLFPGATLRNATRVTLGPDARAILADGFAWHDPLGWQRPFGLLTQQLEIVDGSGRSLVREHGELHGAAFVEAGSPLGPFRASGSLVILARAATLPPPADLQRVADGAGCLSGATDLPNGAGRLLRCLANDGADLRRGLDAAFTLAFTALVGVPPAPRRK